MGVLKKSAKRRGSWNRKLEALDFALSKNLADTRNPKFVKD